MKRIGAVLWIAFAVAAITFAGWTDGATSSLQEGIYAEQTVGDLQAAINAFQRVIDSGTADRSTLAQAYLHLAECNLKLGQNRQAQAALETVIAQFSDDLDAVARAREGLDKCKAGENKTDAQQLTEQGWQLWQQRNLTEAEKTFDAAVLKDPDNVNAWNGLGWSRSNQGKVTAAKEAFEKCLALEPKHAAALNGLGWIAKSEGKTEEAIGHWKKAVEAAPGATAALNGLATTYMELGQNDLAAKYYKMWLEAEPNNVEAKAGLEKATGKPVNPEPRTSAETRIPGSIESEGITWFLAGNDRAHYEIRVDAETKCNGKPSCCLRSSGTETKGFGTMMRELDASPYREKRLRMKAQVKANQVEDWAGLWMRIDGPSGECLGFDNMQSRPIKGATGWQSYEVVLDVPKQSARIACGILLTGKGEVWLADFKLEPTGSDVPTTNMK